MHKKIVAKTAKLSIDTSRFSPPTPDCLVRAHCTTNMIFYMLLFTQRVITSIQNMTISYTEDKLLNQADLIRMGIFSTQDAEKILAAPKGKLNPALFRLVKKGRLIRIKRSLFCIQPPGTKDSGISYPCNWYLIAKALCAEQPYFISHYSAMQLHGMTTQPVQTIFVSRLIQNRPPRQLRIPIRFITVPKKHFWGLEEKWVTNEEKVRVSNVERTILDALDRVDLSGGITEIARGLELCKQDLQVAELVESAKRFYSDAALKRLGFLLETLAIGSAGDFEKLRRRLANSKSYTLLDPTLKTTGHYTGSWRLIINHNLNNVIRDISSGKIQ